MGSKNIFSLYELSEEIIDMEDTIIRLSSKKDDLIREISAMKSMYMQEEDLELLELFSKKYLGYSDKDEYMIFVSED
ncbi:hypothetical protein GUI12_03060 [Anaplasmataceae bacterium AB001_6]|nr:hypothetical protein GUI12_03060 [Anaplasmataceae bacterium AB001_6]